MRLDDVARNTEDRLLDAARVGDDPADEAPRRSRHVREPRGQQAAVSDSAVATVAPRPPADRAADPGRRRIDPLGTSATLATWLSPSRTTRSSAIAARRPGRQGRLDRLAVPAPLRLPRVLRRAARHPGERPLAAGPGRRGRAGQPALRRRHRPAGDDLHHFDRGGRPARRDADRRRACRRRTHASRARAARCGCATSGSCASTTAGPAVGVPPAGRRRRVIVAVAGPDKFMLRGPRLPHGQDSHHADEYDLATERGDDVLHDIGPGPGAHCPGARCPSTTGSCRRPGHPVRDGRAGLSL